MASALILGAGPAGTAAAIMLRKAGHAVTILEKSSFPRFRPGESCHPGLEPLLRLLGVHEAVHRLRPWRHPAVCVNTDGAVSVQPFNEGGDWCGYQLPRAEFDAVLLEEAIRLGCRYHRPEGPFQVSASGDRVHSIIYADRRYEADCYVDATGTKATLCRRLGIDSVPVSGTRYSFYARIRTTVPMAAKYDAYFETAGVHSAYIARLSEAVYSLTATGAEATPEVLRRFAAQHFPADRQFLLEKGFDTTWRIRQPHDYVNLYAVGDAFLQFDPVSSKGILKAITTGIQAAHLIGRVSDGACAGESAGWYYRWGLAAMEKEIRTLRQLLPDSLGAGYFRPDSGPAGFKQAQPVNESLPGRALRHT